MTFRGSEGFFSALGRVDLYRHSPEVGRRDASSTDLEKSGEGRLPGRQLYGWGIANTRRRFRLIEIQELFVIFAAN